MHARTCFYLIGSFLLVLGMLPVCAAQHPSITVLEPQALVTQTQQVGTRFIRHYTFVVTVSNNGSAPSDNITFFLIDPELHSNFSLGNCMLQPGESKQFSTTDYPIAIQGAFLLNISWAPTSPQVPQDQYNSGVKSFTIGGATTKKSTPGFECAFVILALGITALVYRKKIR